MCIVEGFSKLKIDTCSTELRELEAMLKSAYMNKERSAQMAEKQSRKYDEMVG